MSSENIAHEEQRSLEDEFKVALNVVFATSLDKKQEHEVSKDVLTYWKEHVNPGKHSFFSFCIGIIAIVCMY